MKLFPARAGLNRNITAEQTAFDTVPRTRGAEPLFPLDDVLGYRCSPHARG